MRDVQAVTDRRRRSGSMIDMIALPADTDDPEDFDAAPEALDRGQKAHLVGAHRNGAVSPRSESTIVGLCALLRLRALSA